MKIAHLIPTVLGGGGGVVYETPSYSHALGSGLRAGLNGKFTTNGVAPMWGLADTYAASGYYHDGDTGTNAGYTNHGIDVANEWMQYDFTGQASPTYKADKIKFYYSDVFDCGVFKVQAYIGAAWADVSSNFTLGASATQEVALTGAVGFTKLRILGVSGTSSFAAYWREIEFSIGGEA